MLWYINTQYSVSELSPVIDSRVASCRPAFWKWEKNVQALKFGSRLLYNPLIENSAEVKKEPEPEVAQAEPEAARVGPVEQEIKPKVEQGDKPRNNQGPSKRKLSQQDKKIQKRPSRVLARVSFVCIEYAAYWSFRAICETPYRENK